MFLNRNISFYTSLVLNIPQLQLVEVCSEKRRGSCTWQLGTLLQILTLLMVLYQSELYLSCLRLSDFIISLSPSGNFKLQDLVLFLVFHTLQLLVPSSKLTNLLLRFPSSQLDCFQILLAGFKAEQPVGYSWIPAVDFLPTCHRFLPGILFARMGFSFSSLGTCRAEV